MQGASISPSGAAVYRVYSSDKLGYPGWSMGIEPILNVNGIRKETTTARRFIAYA